MSRVLAPEPALAARGPAVGLAAAIERSVLPVGAAAGVGGLAAANGGFFPASWTWASLGFLWVTAIALLLRSPTRLRGFEALFLGALAVLVAWVLLSTAWTNDVTQSVFEGERSLVLLAGVAAALALAPRRATRALLGGVLAGVIVVNAYALATRLFPGRVGSYDPLAVYRLSTPIGYWNGLGITAVIGALIALGFALRARRLLGCVPAAASLLVLLPTLYFTYSRG